MRTLIIAVCIAFVAHSAFALSLSSLIDKDSSSQVVAELTPELATTIFDHFCDGNDAEWMRTDAFIHPSNSKKIQDELEANADIILAMVTGQLPVSSEIVEDELVVSYYEIAGKSKAEFLIGLDAIINGNLIGLEVGLDELIKRVGPDNADRTFSEFVSLIQGD